MFEQQAKTTGLKSGSRLLELIYHATVRSVRQSHGNALFGLVMNILQAIIMVFAFYVMFSILGLRSSAVRGDFLLYIMSGIFLFLTHTKTLAAVVSSEGPASPMMKHAPMNTLIAICASAIGALYIQVLSLIVVFVCLSRRLCTGLYFSARPCIRYVADCMVFRRRHRHDFSRTETLAAGVCRYR